MVLVVIIDGLEFFELGVIVQLIVERSSSLILENIVVRVEIFVWMYVVFNMVELLVVDFFNFDFQYSGESWVEYCCLIVV